MPVHDDTYFINQVLQGNTNAYSYLVEKYKRMTYTLALKIVQVPEDAEEVAQDAFINAFKALAGFKDKSKFSTWLYRIVYNASLAKLRNVQSEKILLDDYQNSNFDVLETEDMLTQLTTREQNAVLHNAIKQLSADEQVLITLYYMNESPVKDIARITGDSESNVKVKLFRARRKLWEMLKHSVHD